MESNDSPEIPDGGETSDIPGLPSGGERRERREVKFFSVLVLVTSLDSSTAYPVSSSYLINYRPSKPYGLHTSRVFGVLGSQTPEV